MDFYLATLALLAGIGLIAVSNLIDGRRRRLFSPGVVPTMPLLLAGVVIVLLAVAYFLTLFRDYR